MYVLIVIFFVAIPKLIIRAGRDFDRESSSLIRETRKNKPEELPFA